MGTQIKTILLIAHLRPRSVLETCSTGGDEATCPMLVSKTHAVPN